MKSAVDLWANFLFNEKFNPAELEPNDVVKLLSLCSKLAEIRRPCIKMYKDKIEMRRLVCQTAIEMGIDLLAIKKRKNQHGGTKPAIGRGLLDIWNEEYAKKFGGNHGTAGAAEVIRRGIVTRMCEDRDKPVS